MLKYHFTIHIHFKSDIDLNFIENELSLKASEKLSFSESSENPKKAKILFKTESFSEKDVSGFFNEFVVEFQVIFQKINFLCKQFDGLSGLVVYFERYSSKAETKIDLNFETLKILTNNDIYFDREYKI